MSAPSTVPTDGAPRPKLCGADVELGNFISGQPPARGRGRAPHTGRIASRELLAAFARVTGGIGQRTDGQRWPVNPQDVGRIWLPGNGGCGYIDLDHLELCLPEVTSAFDHVAAWHAMLALTQDALRDANAARPAERPISVLVNNSDGQGNSYGSHLNVLLARGAWDCLMGRKLHQLAFLMAHQVSSLVLTGQGKVGSENGTPDAAFQLSQRADFLETLLGRQTTWFRPLINTRDEPLSQDARLHVICYDSTLCQVGSLLRIGPLQLVLAMIEAGRLRAELALEDPLEAIQLWSRDPSLETRAPLVDGRMVTAPELQLLFAESAAQFVETGEAEEVVPRAGEIVTLWCETMEILRRKEWSAAARRLDWALKLATLERALRQRPDLDWQAPELKHLDHLYAGLDPEQGLFWHWARAGVTDTVVSQEAVAHLRTAPPDDTRAWARAHLLREAGTDAIDSVDWDRIAFRLPGPLGRRRYWRIDLPDPLGGTRAHWPSGDRPSLAGRLEALGATSQRPVTGPQGRRSVPATTRGSR